MQDGDLAIAQSQVLLQALVQPVQRLDPLGEDDQPVFRRGALARGLPSERLSAPDGVEQRLVLGVVARPDLGQRVAKNPKRRDLGCKRALVHRTGAP